MIQFRKNYVVNNSQIEILPYEVLEEIVKQIIPKSILAENVPVCFEAVKALSHTNKKMYLFIHSDRIHRHVVDVVLKNMNETLAKQKDRQFSIKFLRWYIISNQLDQFISYFHKTLKTVDSVFHKKPFACARNMFKMRYYAKNLAYYRVGNARQIKTGLIASFSDTRQGFIEILHPLGKLTVVGVHISTVESLIKRLRAPFEGIFEKHKCLENGLVEDITQNLRENDLFEFVEHRDLSTPYYKWSSRSREGASRLKKFDNFKDINDKKGRKKLIFCKNASLFSCYQIDHTYPEIVHRNTGAREKEFLFDIVKAYFYTTMDRMDCNFQKRPCATYLDIHTVLYRFLNANLDSFPEILDLELDQILVPSQGRGIRSKIRHLFRRKGVKE